MWANLRQSERQNSIKLKISKGAYASHSTAINYVPQNSLISPDSPARRARFLLDITT
jgi:hypothetical protein